MEWILDQLVSQVNSQKRIIAFSDTHGHHKKLVLPEPLPGDILVFAGDMCSFGDDRDIYKFASWFKELPYDNKVLVAGNHDTPFEFGSRNTMRQLFTGWAYYLENSGAWVNGLYFYGSPVTPSFGNWAFNVERGSEAILQVWSAIPTKPERQVDILVTHGPPHGIFDVNANKQNCGCKDLYARVMEVKPKAHIFGHIHQNTHTVYDGVTRFANVAICDNQYQPKEKPTVIYV